MIGSALELCELQRGSRNLAAREGLHHEVADLPSDPVPALFRVGDRVVARNVNPPGHTRIPRYLRGQQGVIDRDHGVFIFPDTHAVGQGRKPQHVYSVQFTARELWGPADCPNDCVDVDLWDDYLLGDHRRQEDAVG